ncbi:F-box protein CPR1 [Jatropha curcas]|uniref:F-box protein CPR1 n=1 Tax=Jatropha curcas TaxID=180498 RepID=UPI00189600DC|nr:F-box protein CPR1 [Jatropha curcas]
MEIRVPEDIVAEIFLKLEVKSLLRFKSISKSCNSLISSPDFIKSHLHQSKDYPTVYSGNQRQTRAIALTGVSWDFSSNKIVSTPDSRYSLIVWNPATRECRVLPDPEKFVSYGLGYDSATDDYKVIRWGSREITVHSLKSNRIQKIKVKVDFRFYQAGTFIHGALHWVVADWVIAAFNLADDKILQLEIPNRQADEIICNLGVFRGCLCYFSRNGHVPCHLNVWVMKEYGVTTSWTKFVTIPPERVRVFPYKATFCCRNDAIFIVANKYDGTSALFWYDLKNKESKNLKTFKHPVVARVVSFVESLVSPKLN